MRSDRLITPHGEVILVELGDDPGHPDERAHVETLSAHRRREWIAGRAALRQLLPAAGGAILSDDRGAPVVPRGFVASVTHKGALAAAIVAPDTGARLGLDLELAMPSRFDIARRILTPRERAQIRDPRDVTLAFSIKEAIYKAVDPFVRRYVGFQEVDLDVHADGTVVVTSALGLAIEATWREHDGHWLTTARARGSLSTYAT